MIKHIVAWNFKDEFSHEENLENARKVKEQLEELKDIVSGIISIEVIISPLKSSSFDVVLVSEFESIEALNGYQVHDEHVKVGTFVKSVFKDRKCIDYEI